MPKKDRKKAEKESPQKEKSELEEEIEQKNHQEEKVISEEFSPEFFKIPEGSFLTSLEKLNNTQKLEEVENSSFFSKEVQKQEVKYDVGYNPSDYENVASERKKISDENIITKNPLKINLENARIDFQPRFEGSSIQLNPELQQLRRQSAFKEERDYIVSDVQRIEDNKHLLPFEKTERKYKGKAI